MRTQENVKTNHKAPTSLAIGSPLNKLPVKKIYCPKCQRLVKGHIQGTAIAVDVACPRCNLVLWSWKTTSWRSAVRSGAAL
jgi:hypothetical protein